MADEIDQRSYLEEHFTTGCILCGKIQYLEEIKKYIIKTYVKNGLLKMIRPTYSKRPLSVVTESHYRKKEVSESVPDSEDYYFAFVLNGEVTYTGQVKEYIKTYVEKGVVELDVTLYSKERQFVVGQ